MVYLIDQAGLFAFAPVLVCSNGLLAEAHAPLAAFADDIILAPTSTLMRHSGLDEKCLAGRVAPYLSQG